jgi:hypothetical protein
LLQAAVSPRAPKECRISERFPEVICPQDIQKGPSAFCARSTFSRHFADIRFQAIDRPDWGAPNANVAFFPGDPKTTHISTLAGGFGFSQKKQLFFGVGFSMFAEDDRWFFQGDDRLQLTSQDIYGLGTNYVRIYETAYRRVRPGLFLGLGLNLNSHSNVRPGDGSPPGSDESPFLTYSRTHGFAPDRQASSGTSIGLLFDTRDNAINPQGGWLASAIYRTFFSGSIGGDSTWQQLYLDLRTYKELSNDGRHKLAFWLIGNLVTGGTAPYLDLPSTGSDGRSARGYIESRYRGEHLVDGEVETRNRTRKSLTVKLGQVLSGQW